MQDRRIELTRRKILASAGAIGVAGATAGLGTSAYFSDEESFENNTLAAGELDLTVDWEEHYWNDFATDVDVVRVDDPSEVGDGMVALPDPANPLVAVDDLATFMAATAVEAYPDGNDDGIQDDLTQYDACRQFADTPDGLDPFGDGYRSMTPDTVIDFDEGSYAPLVSLHDVKPGDFGELTLSFHLCDNPGYVWLQGTPVMAAENGITEPEGDSSDAGAGDEQATGQDVLESDVELLDAVETMLWYDEDGDNVFEPGGTTDAADVVLVLDRSGSMSGTKLSNAKDAAKTLVDEVGANTQVGVVSFSSGVVLDQGLTTNKAAAKSAIDGLSAGGSTNIEGGVDAANEELTGDDVSGDVTASGNDRDGANKIMVVLSDGAPNVNGDGVDEGGPYGADPVDNATDAKNAGIEVYTVGFGISAGSTTAQTLEDMASAPKPSHAYLGSIGDLGNIFSQIGQIIAGEEVFFRGTLRELLAATSAGAGIPLDGDRSSEFDEVADPPDSPDREEFVNSTNNFVGLAWWVSRDVGNEIQSDAVGFDIGFYAEQSRHNDGGGQATS